MARIRALVRAGDYVMTLHAEEEMDDDGFSVFDVEHALLSGKIVDRQTDRQSNARKYVIEGRTADNTAGLVAVVRFGLGGKLVIVTVYAN